MLITWMAVRRARDRDRARNDRDVCQRPFCCFMVLCVSRRWIGGAHRSPATLSGGDAKRLFLDFGHSYRALRRKLARHGGSLVTRLFIQRAVADGDRC